VSGVGIVPSGQLNIGTALNTFAQAAFPCVPATGRPPLSLAVAHEIVLADGLPVIVGKDIDAGALAHIIEALARR
jgi:hypothetical protein